MSTQIDIMSFGPTLARETRPADARKYLDGIDADKAVGVVHVAIIPSYQPGVLQVEALIDDGTDPIVAAQALQVASKRIATIHALGEVKPPVTLNVNDAKARARAERLVDMCRDATIKEPSLHSFDHPRENCVRAIMAAMVRGDV